MSEQEINSCLASYAVFRNLYNKNRDVYDVLGEFITDIIINRTLLSFTVDEIRTILKDEYGFDLPTAVIYKAIVKKEIASVSKSNFNIKVPLTQLKSKIENYEEFRDQIDVKIIKDLHAYIEEKTKKKIEISQIQDSFVNFLYGTKPAFSIHIGAYIIEKQENNPEFITILNQIQEGVILISGLLYSKQHNQNTWTEDLTIYLDMEILFNAAGYNGELYRVLFEDFIKLVNEINHKDNTRKKNIICLKYFRHTKYQIENYFKYIEFIIDGKAVYKPNETAAKTILEDCQDKAAIVLKQGRFFNFLKTIGIEEDTFDYYSQDNMQYGMNSHELIEKLKDQFQYEVNDQKINESMKELNQIMILRQNTKEYSFANCKFTFLTGTNLTLAIAKNGEYVRDISGIPLASDIYFLTNKFWFSMSKGLGEKDSPISFSTITKARIILASELNSKVLSAYRDIEKKYNAKEMTIEDVELQTSILRKTQKTPEEMTYETLEDSLMNITEDGIEKTYKEYKKTKKELLEVTTSYRIQEAKQKLVMESLKSQLTLLNKFQIENQENIDKEIKKAEKLDLITNKRIKQSKIYSTLITTLIALITLFLSYKLNIVTILSFAISVLVFIIQWIFLFCTEGRFTPEKYFIAKHLKLKEKVYIKNDYNPELIKQLEDKMADINDQIQKIKYAHLNLI